MKKRVRTVEAPIWRDGRMTVVDFNLPDVERIIKSGEGYRRKIWGTRTPGHAEMLSRKLLEHEDTIARLTRERDEARAELAALRQQVDPCEVCAGEGTPTSGGRCICGGTGRGADEKAGLRAELHALRQQVTEDPVRRVLARGGYVLGPLEHRHSMAQAHVPGGIYANDPDPEAAARAALAALEAGE